LLGRAHEVNGPMEMGADVERIILETALACSQRATER